MTVMTNGHAPTQLLSSPFGALSPAAESEAPVAPPAAQPLYASAALASPFAALAPGDGETEGEDEEVAAFLESLHDEDFTEALEGLVDEAASRYLAGQGEWSGRPGEVESYAALEDWIAPLAEAAERAVDSLADTLGAADAETLHAGELEALLEGAQQVAPTGIEGFDHFLGKLMRKVGTFARNAVKKAGRIAGGALKAVGKIAGKILPIGPLLRKLARLVRPLLTRVLKMAIGKLPAPVRPLAAKLAKRFGVGEAEAAAVHGAAGAVAALAEDFDTEVAALLYGPESEQHEAWTGAEEARDAVAELETARALLAEQLSDPASEVTAEAAIQQFVPAVLAVKPLIKLGISVIGRDKVVRFLGDRVAGLIKGLVGAQAAKLLSRPMVDVGMRIFGFEGPEGREALPGEALASVVEGTLMRTLDLLPGEAYADELQLDSAVQEAFAEAAAAYLPDRLLRADLPERETAGEGGVWVLMPRAARPRYRYRKFTRVYVVPVTRQQARAVPFGESTLEEHLLDRGATSWPVQAEVHLYEAVPGTQFGHLTQDETLPAGERPDGGEFEALTPEVAGLLLGEPSLGRRAAGAVPGSRGRPVPGGRYFRVRTPDLRAGQAGHRRRRRVLVGLDLPAGRMRVSVRLSERQAQQVLARLQPAARGAARDLPGTLAMLRGVYAARLYGTLAARLARRALVTDAAAAGPVADKAIAAVTAALSAFLTTRPNLLATAVTDPADGVTLTVTFSGVTKATLAGGLPAGEVSVTPGWGGGRA